MSTKSEVSVAAQVADEAQGLRKNSVGLITAMMLGVVILSPSLAIFFNWGFMVPSVGISTAIIFAIALAMSLPTAYSYALINTRMPAAGATYKWASRLISPHVGIAAGLCTTLFYACFLPTELPFIGLVASDLARTTSSTVMGLVMAGTLAISIPFIYRGVAFNLDAAAVIVVIEVTIITTIAVVALASSGHGHLSLAPLDPSRLPSTSLMIPALVLAVLSFTGYDAISTLADEAKMARKLIPRATILAVVLVGVFWLVISTVLSDALPPSAYLKVIKEGGFPLAAAAATAFGSVGRDVIDLMGIEAGFGLLIAASIGSTRIIYAMGRDKVLSPRFGTVHRRFQVPWFALTSVVIWTVLVDVLLSLYLGVSFNITLWLANLIVFFALITYLVINVCNPLLFLRHFRSEFHWFSNGVIPIVGVAVTGYFLYKGFFEVLLNSSEFKMGGSVVVAALGLTAAAIVVALVVARRASVREAARRHSVGDPFDKSA